MSKAMPWPYVRLLILASLCAARYSLDSANREFNIHNKAFGAVKKVRAVHDCGG